MQDSYKKSLLGLFFAFFLDKSKFPFFIVSHEIVLAGKIKQVAPPPEEQSTSKKEQLNETTTNIEEHNDSGSDKLLDNSFHAHLEEFEERYKDIKSETSKEGSTRAEEQNSEAGSFADHNRKFSFISTPGQDMKSQGSQSFEQNPLEQNIGSVSPKQVLELTSEKDVNKESQKPYLSGTPVETMEEKFRKLSLDEGGVLEKERIIEFSLEEVIKSMDAVPTAQRSSHVISGLTKSLREVSKSSILDKSEMQPKTGENVTEKSSNIEALNYSVTEKDILDNNVTIVSPVLDAKKDQPEEKAQETDPQSSSDKEEAAKLVLMEKFITKEIPKFSGDM